MGKIASLRREPTPSRCREPRGNARPERQRLTENPTFGEGLISFPGCEYFASSVGALLSLLLWCVAQRLFLATPSKEAPSKGVHD